MATFVYYTVGVGKNNTRKNLGEKIILADKIVYNEHISELQGCTFPSQQDLLLLAHRVKSQVK